jgi:hypothetical protein
MNTNMGDKYAYYIHEYMNSRFLAYRRYRGDLIEVFKITHGLYDEQGTKKFVVPRESNTRRHQFALYKQQCRLDLRKYAFRHRAIDQWNAFRHRVIDQWNHLPGHVVNVKTVASFERNLDKLWMGSEAMFSPDANLELLTSARSIRGSAHPETVEKNSDLMSETR